jgi:hypothetical protein
MCNEAWRSPADESISALQSMQGLSVLPHNLEGLIAPRNMDCCRSLELRDRFRAFSYRTHTLNLV